MQIKNTIITLAISGFNAITTLNAMEPICSNIVTLENKSGWALTIKSIHSNKMETIPMRQDTHFVELGCLDTLLVASVERRGNVWGAFAKPFLLDDYIKKLKREAPFYPDKRPIIIVNATMFNWDISIDWESNITPITKEIEAEAFDLVSLEDIIDGKLGEELAQKVGAILDADYDIAVKQGSINLYEQLEKEFTETFKEVKTIAEKPIIIQAGPLRGAQRHFMLKLREKEKATLPRNDAIETINRLHRVLLRYKEKGLVK